jgi:hypothetical protein
MTDKVTDATRGQLFGPFYPPALQEIVNHLEAFSSLVSTREAASDDRATPWVCGRADEIAEFVRDVLHRWRKGRSSEAEAASALTDYLGFLHEGFCRHVQATTTCCRRATDATTIAPATSGTTREVPLAAVVHVEVPAGVRKAETTEMRPWPPGTRSS